MHPDHVHRFLAAFEAPLAPVMGDGDRAPVELTGSGALPSVFAVTDFATASVACAGRAAARLAGDLGSGPPPTVAVDARLASWWYLTSLQPEGWERGGMWDSVAGIYPAEDGHVRLHTNAPHHKARALAVLGVDDDRQAVARAVGRWSADALETAVVGAGGCAAALRGGGEWAAHPQGAAVAAEPLIHWEPTEAGRDLAPVARPARPLAGVRVLDLTRVLAGPVATRFLAGLGADVIRVDPPWWSEPAVESEVTLGKRCARLDLRDGDDLDHLRALLADADLFVHGYRSDALDRLGLGPEVRRELAPGLVDVSLDAYGWTGPWRARRGFDSLVQLSSGLAFEPMEIAGATEPTPLPAQALDHATGYLMAAAAIHGWANRLSSGRGSRARLSLARTARALADGPRTSMDTSVAPLAPEDFVPELEQTSWGPGRRLRPPVAAGPTVLHWGRPATALGTAGARVGWL
ncbi:MAG: CoA transferase [Actinomycetota bacterium]